MSMAKLLENMDLGTADWKIRGLGELQEYRCHCGRLLGKFSGRAEVKCPRCGKVNDIGVEEWKHSLR